MHYAKTGPKRPTAASHLHEITYGRTTIEGGASRGSTVPIRHSGLAGLPTHATARQWLPHRLSAPDDPPIRGVLAGLKREGAVACVARRGCPAVFRSSHNRHAVEPEIFVAHSLAAPATAGARRAAAAPARRCGSGRRQRRRAHAVRPPVAWDRHARVGLRL